MKFGFIAKHRGIWPIGWLCEALGVSRSGFYAWLSRPPSRRARADEELSGKVRASFLASDRTYGARRVWHDLLAEGVICGRHRIERLMRLQTLRARPRRRRLPSDVGERQPTAIATNVLDRSFEAPAQPWLWDATYWSRHSSKVGMACLTPSRRSEARWLRRCARGSIAVQPQPARVCGLLTGRGKADEREGPQAHPSLFAGRRISIDPTSCEAVATEPDL